MGTNRIQRSQSKQQFVCFVGCPRCIRPIFSKAEQPLGRKKKLLPPFFFFFFYPNNREHLNEPVCLLDDSFGQVSKEGQGAMGG